MSRVVWRIVELFLARHVPHERITPILGDLQEEFAARRHRGGLIRSYVWVTHEALSLALAYRRGPPMNAPAPRRLMDKLRLDFRFAWRSMLGRPVATFATIFVLGLGVGAVSAMFALSDPFLLRALPYARPAELVAISLAVEHGAVPHALPTLEDWQARTDLFSSIAAYESGQTLRITLRDGAVAMRTAAVSKSFFETLGVGIDIPPHWGSGPSSAETLVVLTPHGPKRLLESQPLGAALSLEEPRSLRVVGILPRSFVFPRLQSARTFGGLTPLHDTTIIRVRQFGGRVAEFESRSLIARLRPDVTAAQVRAALSTQGIRVIATPLTSNMTERFRRLALGALLAGALILVVCAANVAGLLLTRFVHRSREFAARYALGATRVDVVRMLLVEIALLATFGAAVGLGIGWVVLSASAAVIPTEYVLLGMPSISARVAGFGLLSTMLIALIGAIPAWLASRAPRHAIAHSGSGGDARLIRRFRLGLAVAQSAIAVVLMSGALLLGRSFVNLVGQDAGFNSDTTIVSVSYPSHRTGADLQNRIDATITNLQRIDGVGGVAASIGALLDDTRMVGGIRFEGRPALITAKTVTPNYFRIIGSPIVKGRPPSEQDPPATVCVVNQAFQRQYSPTQSPVGRTIQRGTQSLEIVGVVADSYDIAFDEPAQPTVFSVLHNPSIGMRVHYTLATSKPVLDKDYFERAVTTVDVEAILVEDSTIQERLMRSIRDRSFATLILIFFAVAALGICVAGLSGIVMHTVARRTHEIAVRMAIGASASVVRHLVMREAVVAAGSGCALGVAAALSVSGLLQHLLYGVEATDPLSLALAASLCLAVTGLAAWIPARRATRLSPASALRAE